MQAVDHIPLASKKMCLVVGVLSFNLMNHKIDGSTTYDAAGNVMRDAFHQYTYDAENNLIAVDNGSTATYVYDALNQRVQVKVPSAPRNTLEYTYDFAGRRVTTWDANANSGIQGQVWWGNRPFAYRDVDGTTYFQFGDWEGTQRVLTNYAGSVSALYTSNPFGDGYSANGYDDNRSHYAGLEHDAESGTDHAQFRQYDTVIGNWTSMDPYAGSYDFTNPQSLNRHAYSLNNPTSFVDPSGLDCTTDENGNVTCNTYGFGYAPITWPCLTYGYCGGQTGSSPDPVNNGNTIAPPPPYARLGIAPNNAPTPDKKSCAARLAAGVQKYTGTPVSNLQYTGAIGGHANYTFDVSDPTGFQSILNQNMPWSWAGPLDEGHRYGIVMSTHILDPVNGSYSGPTDLFNGHSILAPLHWIVDVGIGHIPGVNLDFGCKAGS